MGFAALYPSYALWAFGLHGRTNPFLKCAEPRVRRADLFQPSGERVRRETAQYTTLTQMASASGQPFDPKGRARDNGVQAAAKVAALPRYSLR
jgi:hypothetical protein